MNSIRSAIGALAVALAAPTALAAPVPTSTDEVRTIGAPPRHETAPPARMSRLVDGTDAARGIGLSPAASPPLAAAPRVIGGTDDARGITTSRATLIVGSTSAPLAAAR